MDNLAVTVPSPTRVSMAALLALAALALPESLSAQGCAMCGTVGTGADDPLVKGMFVSILFMVSMPFAVCSSVGGWLWYRTRQARSLALPGETEDPAP